MKKKSLRIAVCLFGHLRSYKKCYKSIRNNLIDIYNCDVFMHTWSDFDHCTLSWHSLNVNKSSKSVFSYSDYLKRIYKLRTLSIEKQDSSEEGFFFSNKDQLSLKGLRSMVHSMCISFSQIQNDYDYVVFCRPDILLKSKFDISSFVSDMSDEEVNFSFFTVGNYQFCHILNSFEQIYQTDVIFFARPHVLHVVLKDFDCRVNSIENGQKFPYIPEYLLLDTVINSDFRIQLINYIHGQDYEIIRGKHIVFSKKGFINFRIRKNSFSLKLLSGFFSVIMRVHFSLFDRFVIEIVIGGDIMLKD